VQQSAGRIDVTTQDGGSFSIRHAGIERIVIGESPAAAPNDAALDQPEQEAVAADTDDGNLAPVADASGHQAVGHGNTVSLDATHSFDWDSPGGLTYQWTQTGGPSVELSDPNSAHATFAAPEVTEPTQLSFQLSVSDSEGLSDSVNVHVTVAPPSHEDVAHVDADPAWEGSIESPQPSDQDTVLNTDGLDSDQGYDDLGHAHYDDLIDSSQETASDPHSDVVTTLVSPHQDVVAPTVGDASYPAGTTEACGSCCTDVPDATDCSSPQPSQPVETLWSGHEDLAVLDPARDHSGSVELERAGGHGERANLHGYDAWDPRTWNYVVTNEVHLPPATDSGGVHEAPSAAASLHPGRMEDQFVEVGRIGIPAHSHDGGGTPAAELSDAFRADPEIPAQRSFDVSTFRRFDVSHGAADEHEQSNEPALTEHAWRADKRMTLDADSGPAPRLADGVLHGGFLAQIWGLFRGVFGGARHDQDPPASAERDKPAVRFSGRR
jgi:hypothetical protein